jgi:hypothetical protein
MVGDPVYATESTKALTMYAVDAGGSLWRRNQLAPGNDTYLAWRQFSAPVGLTADFTLVQNGTGIDVVARKADGTVQTATITGTTLSAWRIVGTGAVDRPAAVVHSNGDLQVFVRTADGAIVTQRETNNAFPQVWQPTPAVAAAGAPAALIRPSGLIDLAVRGTDNFVYQSSQVAPAGSFGEWRVQYPQDTATDPTSLVLTDGTPIFTWRSPDGTIQTVFKPNAQFAGQSSRPQPAER